MQERGGDLRTKPIHRAGLKALAALLAGALAACGVGERAPGFPEAPAGVPASAPAANSPSADLLAGRACPDAPGPIDAPIVANQVENLAGVTADGLRSASLTALPSGTRAYAPAWSPDGETLAFAFFFPAPDLAWLQVGMICGLDRQTGQGRILARADFPESLEEASWAPDGRSLLLTHLRHNLNERNEFVSTATGVVRYDLAAGALVPLVADAIRPALSPDGALLAFIQLDPASGSIDRRLMVAAADGSQPRLLLDQRTNHWMLDSPRWSPDSRQLIVTASARQQAGRPARPGGWLFGAATAEAHGDPAHLWLLNADGSGLRQVTALPLDDPHAAWAPDGQRIAYVTTLGAVRVLDLGSKQEQQLTQPGFAGLIDWNWTP